MHLDFGQCRVARMCLDIDRIAYGQGGLALRSAHRTCSASVMDALIPFPTAGPAGEAEHLRVFASLFVVRDRHRCPRSVPLRVRCESSGVRTLEGDTTQRSRTSRENRWWKLPRGGTWRPSGRARAQEEGKRTSPRRPVRQGVPTRGHWCKRTPPRGRSQRGSARTSRARNRPDAGDAASDWPSLVPFLPHQLAAGWTIFRMLPPQQARSDAERSRSPVGAASRTSCSRGAQSPFAFQVS